MNVSFVLVKMWPSVCNHPLDFNAAFVGKTCLDLRRLSRLTSPVSTYVACLGTSFDVTSRDDEFHVKNVCE